MIREPAAIGSWCMLAALAVVPIRLGTSSVSTKSLLSAAAFFISAALTRYWLQETRSRLQILAFVAASIVFGLCQWLALGRPPGIGGWVANAASAMVGTLMVKWFLEGTLL